jgi:putative flippase GtrA
MSLASEDAAQPVASTGMQLGRYAVVGLAATAAHYALLSALVEWLGVRAWLGSGCGAVLGAQVAFFLNRRYTFGHEGAMWPAWWRFMGTAALGALAGMGIVAAGVAFGMHYLLAQLVATVLVMVLTFTVNRLWAFA